MSYGPFWSHIFGYFNNRHLPNLLILKYEDLKSDLAGQIERVAAFMGNQLTKSEIEKLGNHLSFDSMRKNPSVNVEHILNLKRKNGEKVGDGQFLRAGVVGKYKTEMSEDVVEEFDRWIEENIRDTEWEL